MGWHADSTVLVDGNYQVPVGFSPIYVIVMP